MEYIQDIVCSETALRCEITAQEVTAGLILEMMHVVGVEMFQRVLVHRLSRVAFRRLKRRARKNRASMARAATRLGMHCDIPSFNVTRSFEDQDSCESDASDTEHVPKVQIVRARKPSSVSSAESVGEPSPRSVSPQCHSPYTFAGYCTTTKDVSGAVIPDDCFGDAAGDHDECMDHEFLEVPHTDCDCAVSPRTCDHHQNWKRLRHKRGISYFVCTACGCRWRKLNANAPKETEYMQFGQPMYFDALSFPMYTYPYAYCPQYCLQTCA